MLKSPIPTPKQGKKKKKRKCQCLYRANLPTRRTTWSCLKLTLLKDLNFPSQIFGLSDQTQTVIISPPLIFYSCPSVSEQTIVLSNSRAENVISFEFLVIDEPTENGSYLVSKIMQSNLFWWGVHHLHWKHITYYISQSLWFSTLVLNWGFDVYTSFLFSNFGWKCCCWPLLCVSHVTSNLRIIDFYNCVLSS